MTIKNVILNEVKNLCSWLNFRCDAILHFVQNDRGGRGGMTDTRVVIAWNGAIREKTMKKKADYEIML